MSGARNCGFFIRYFDHEVLELLLWLLLVDWCEYSGANCTTDSGLKCTSHSGANCTI
jgi:hypothetical protein